MDAGDRNLALRVDMLERTLKEMQRELTCLRRRRRVAPALALALAGSVALAVGGRTLDAQGIPGQKVTAPFTVVDAAGKTVLEVLSNEGRPTLHIGDQGGVWIGRGKSGIGFMTIKRSDDKDAIALGQPEGGTLGVHVFDEAGKGVVSELGVAAGGKSGAITVRASSGAFVLDSRVNAKGHPVLTVGEKGGVLLGSGGSGSGFVVARHADNSDSVALGQLEGGPPGLHVHDSTGKRVLGELVATNGDAGGALTIAGASGAKPTFKVDPGLAYGEAFVGVTANGKGGDLRVEAAAAGNVMFRVSPDASAKDSRVSVGSGTAGYAIHIGTLTGTEIGAFGEAKVGGGVIAVADGTGKTRMLMSGTGQLHASDASGTTRATMTSDGAFSIRSANGTTIARLGEDPEGGVLEIANGAGNAMVDAGITTGGKGFVRTYPFGKAPGTAFGLPGTFIMGMTSK